MTLIMKLECIYVYNEITLGAIRINIKILQNFIQFLD